MIIDSTAIRGKILKDGNKEIEFHNIHEDDIITFPNDDIFVRRYIAKSKAYLSLTRLEGSYEIKVTDIGGKE